MNRDGIKIYKKNKTQMRSSLMTEGKRGLKVMSQGSKIISGRHQDTSQEDSVPISMSERERQRGYFDVMLKFDFTTRLAEGGSNFVTAQSYKV